MTQYAFHAENYDAGTNLINDLDFTNYNLTQQFGVYADTPGKFFRTNSGGFVFRKGVLYLANEPDTDDFECLIVKNLADTTNRLSIGAAGRISGTDFYGVGYHINYDASSVAKYGSVGISGSFSNVTKDVSPAIVAGDINKAVGLRVSCVGNAFKSRLWFGTEGDILSNEPSVWDFEATDAALTTGKVGLLQIESFNTFRATDLAFGTDGQAAVLSPVQPTITTPSALGVSNVTATDADLNWT